jgi:hypothetical protein
VNVVVAFDIDAVTNNEPVLTVTAEPVATVTVNCELSPFVKVITLLTALAVVNNEAVFTVTPAFRAYDAVTAKDAEVALVAKDELVAVCAEVANELLKATELYDDDILVALFDELTAKLALTALEAVILTDVIDEPKPVSNPLPLT